MKSTALFAATLLMIGGSSAFAATSQPAPGTMDRQHDEIARDLSRYAGSGMETAAAAQEVLARLRAHHQKEAALVMPLLSLLPELCDGQVTGDVDFAIRTAATLKAERQTMFDENAGIMSAVGDLIQAGGADKEAELVLLGGSIADHVMSEIEISEPAAILVGDMLLLRLASPR